MTTDRLVCVKGRKYQYQLNRTETNTALQIRVKANKKWYEFVLMQMEGFPTLKWIFHNS